MQLARVTGTVVATVKADNLEGVRLLIVQPLTRDLVPTGQPVVAADALDTAGPGQLVCIVAAREAAEAMPNRFVPVDHAIVGIVDAVEGIAGVPASTIAASTPDEAPPAGPAAGATRGTAVAETPATAAGAARRRRRTKA